ncbi:MAG: FtsX-like permease family protein, partial [Nitrosomonas sp.]|nr:FtsX-like permease family protein [Nitrosomonas sp.]
MNFFRLSFRMLRRDWSAGELNVLVFALVIAVSGMTTVSFFSDRVQMALSQKSNQLLGADLLIISDHPILVAFQDEAIQRSLSTASVTKFHSMVSNGDDNLLVDIKVVTDGYPLRGKLHLATNMSQPYSVLETRITESIPVQGTAWVDEKLMVRLSLNKGDVIDVGEIQLIVAELVMREPDSSVGFMAMHPRVLINESDLPATGLVQEGSRIKYHLMLAGELGKVESYREWVTPRLEHGQQIEGIRDARPEIKSALERAEKFLSLAALASVVLAAAAIALAVRRFIQRHLDGCAVMRSMGASQSNLLNLYLYYFIALGLIASAVGCLLGFVAQEFLAHWLSGLVETALPWPSWLPAIHGLLIGLVLLLGFALPPLLNLRSVPALRVLRRDMGAPNAQSLSAYILGIFILSLLFLWKANDLRLGLYVIGGFIAAIAVFGLLGYLLVKLLSGMRHQTGSAWRYGLASIKRRSISSLVQTIALGLGIMALLVLSVIRDDLIQEWKASLPDDAPNQYVINIQTDQLQPLEDFFNEHDFKQPVLYPMVRGRLAQINDVIITADTFSDLRAERLARRVFNMSWTDELPRDNQIVAGDWWGEGDTDKAFISMEEGIAKTLGIEVGDELTYEVAGSNFTATVANLRKVNWETFQVNFFVVTQPGFLDNFPASYITSFHMPPSDNYVMHELVRTFPNFLVIDVAAVVEQVQVMISQVSKAIEFVFLFTLLAGFAVLYAAIASTQDERIYEAAIFRALGAKRKQLVRTWAAEFVILGGLAGIFAAAGASVLSFVIGHYALHLDYLFNPWIWVAGFLTGAI